VQPGCEAVTQPARKHRLALIRVKSLRSDERVIEHRELSRATAGSMRSTISSTYKRVARRSGGNSCAPRNVGTSRTGERHRPSAARGAA